MWRRFLVRRFWGRVYTGGGVHTWIEEPTVRRAANRRITGSPNVWPMEWFAERIPKRPLARALSLGCGEGYLERDLKAKGLCEEIVGFDLSDDALELARRHARKAGYGGIRYERRDLDRLELRPRSLDGVFAHQSLHHVRDLERCLEQVADALTPGGVLYYDEYVGPSRHEWRHSLLEEAESVYQELPKAARRRRRLRLPVDWRDPSEAVRSSEIVPLTARFLEIRERRDYGGNLLAVIYPHLDLEKLEPEAREDVLDELVAREDEMLAAGAPSYYTVIVAGRRGEGPVRNPAPTPGARPASPPRSSSD